MSAHEHEREYEHKHEHERVQDPVCGRWIDKEKAYSTYEYEHHIFYLCCPMCRTAFAMQPDRFVRRESGKWKRDLER
jgi:YHS domain-containing protein